jgi:hypothetical protein
LKLLLCVKLLLQHLSKLSLYLRLLLQRLLLQRLLLQRLLLQRQLNLVLYLRLLLQHLSKSRLLLQAGSHLNGLRPMISVLLRRTT